MICMKGNCLGILLVDGFSIEEMCPLIFVSSVPLVIGWCRKWYEFSLL